MYVFSTKKKIYIIKKYNNIHYLLMIANVTMDENILISYLCTRQFELNKYCTLTENAMVMRHKLRIMRDRA